MMKRNTVKINILWALVMFPLTSTSNVDGFSPFQLIPENAVEGENVQLYYLGCDRPTPNIISGDYYYLEQNKKLTNTVISMSPGVPLCTLGFEYYYDLGIFNAGSFQIDVYLTTNDTPYPLDLSDRTPDYSILFEVVGEARTVPIINKISLCLLFILIYFFSLKFMGMNSLKPKT